MKKKLLRGTTSHTEKIFIQDTSSSTSGGLTGLTNSSSGLTAYYIKEGQGTATAIALAAGTVGTWSSGGFKEVDSVHMPGIYEIGIPDAALSTGNSSVVMLFGATNMAPVILEFELDAVNYQDAAAFGLSRLDAAISSRMATFILPTNFSSFSIDASGRVDIGKTGGQAVALDSNNLMNVNCKDWNGTAITTTVPNTASVTVTTNNDKTGYTASTVSDKTGYALTTGEHTNIAADVQTGLTAQGLTTARAGYMDVLNGLIAGIWAAATRSLTDKANFALSTAEHTAIATDTQTGLTAQGYTGTRAGYLDTLNGLITGIWAAATRSLTDKVDYGLSSAEHTAIAADVQTGLTAQGFTTTRAGYLDLLTGMAQSVWDVLTSGIAAVGSIGVQIKNNLDTNVGSRAASGSQMTLTPTEESTIASTVWSYLTSAISAVGSIGLLIADNLDAAVSSRAPSNNVVVNGYASGQDPETLVLNATASGFNTAGSIGAKINAAGSSGDPLENLTSTYTGAGTVGKLLADNLNAKVGDVKAKTDNLPATPAATGDAMALTSGERTTLAGIIWGTLTSAITTVGSIGLQIKTNLDTLISSRLAAGNVVVSDYATGKSPGEQILVTPANKLTTDAAGEVNLNLQQALNNSITGDKVGRALVGSLAGGSGSWELVGNVLSLLAQDNTTVVASFLIDNASAPTRRTLQ